VVTPLSNSQIAALRHRKGGSVVIKFDLDVGITHGANSNLIVEWKWKQKMEKEIVRPCGD
jgi:hypothetical protein